MTFLRSRLSLSLIGAGLLMSAVLAFLLATNQPLIKLLRFTVFNAFQFEGDEIGDIRKDLVYKTVNGQPLMVDLYLPLENRQDVAPVVVFSHGGGWVTGDRDTMLIGPDNRQLIVLLRTLGYAVANFEYRLLGEAVTLSDTIADNKDIVRWLRENAEEYQLDPENIGLWGQSAGGYLALMAGLTDDDDFIGDETLSDVSARVSYIVDNYGSTDLVERFGPIASGQRAPGILDRMRTDFMFASSYTENPGAFAADLVKLSPVSYADEADPPVLIVHGDSDGLMPPEQSRILQRKLEDVGTDYELHFVENADHVFIGATDEQIEEIVAMSAAFISRNTFD